MNFIISRPRFLFQLTALLSFSISLPIMADEQEVGFVEQFVLSESREEALKSLIPGTQDYYYYHALHYQNERKTDAYEALMKQWEEKFTKSTERQKIQDREALIRYSDDPEKTLEYLKRQTGVYLNHQQKGVAQKVEYPSVLDQKLVSWEAFLNESLRQKSDLSSLEQIGLYRFLQTEPEMSVVQRRNLLKQITLPDFPGLVDVIYSELSRKGSRGFGEFPIHAQLTKAQLEELLKKKADLRDDEDFVEAYLLRLLPRDDEDMQTSVEVREAYLTRVWDFVKTLSPSFQSLKAHVLYRRLVHDRELGNENEALFLEYLKTPRTVSYLNRNWKLPRDRANLNEDFRAITQMPRVGSDEKLVRQYLLHFLEDAAGFKKYAPYLSEFWLRKVFAEAKVLSGKGEAEDWSSLMSPSEFQALKDRVDIEFDPRNEKFYGVDDAVTLKVELKNVPKLMVKVFEINTLNYYDLQHNEISTDIELDGLVASEVKILEYKQASAHRHAEEIKIPSIGNERGVWVVELIGGGKSSRAVIRKGELTLLSRMVGQGQELTVLDEDYQALSGASIWMREREYECDEKGRVLLPFSNSPGSRSILIQDEKGFAMRARFDQMGEDYALSAQMHVEQESLRSGGTSQILIRPTLTLAGEPISFDNVESATLEMNSLDLDGQSSSTMISKVELLGDREFMHEFRVPNRVTAVTATLRVKVKVASQGGEVKELEQTSSFAVNGTQSGVKVNDSFLKKVDGEYFVQILGRNGEPAGGQVATVIFEGMGSKYSVDEYLRTDENGTIHLGALSGLKRVEIRTGKQRRSWNLETDQREHNNLVTFPEGDDLKVPFVGDLDAREVSFFSMVNDRFLADEFSKLKLENGFLVANGLVRGDYRLIFRESGEVMQVKVAKGKEAMGYVFNEARVVELPKREPSHLKPLKVNDKAVEVSVVGADPLTRVHVIATNFVSGSSPFGQLQGAQRSYLKQGEAAHLKSLYLSGRTLGDELRYILERKYFEKHVGNMLARPEILLNPWAVRDTESGAEILNEGDDFGRVPVPAAAPMPAAQQSRKPSSPSVRDDAFSAGGGGVQSPSYEFLRHAPVMVENLVPDENGVITLDRDLFGDRQHVHVLLVDPDGTTYRTVSLEDKDVEFRDLTLKKGLDPDRHFAEKNQVVGLKKGEALELLSREGSQFQYFDQLTSVYEYLLRLKEDASLREFRFLLDWPKLSMKEKTEKYSKYASHELSFFLSRKDPAFFKEVVLPHLVNKRDRTFLDDYLLGADLTKYHGPYEYARLNVVERILLVENDPKGLASLQADLKGRLELKPRDLAKDQYLYDGVFWSASLGDGDDFGDGWGASSGGSLGRDESSSYYSSNEDGLREVNRVAGRADFKKRELQKKSKRRRQGNSADRSLEGDPFAAPILSEGEEERLAPQYYRGLEVTKEWAETNYYKLPILSHQYDLIPENRFWLDAALNGVKEGFASRYLGEATGNFSEMMFVLSFMDLPFEAPEHQREETDGGLKFTAGGPTLFFYRELKEVELSDSESPLLISQSFYQHDDRYRMVNGEKVDKFVTQEFVRGVVYGSEMVVTNPTTSSQRLDLLAQIPQGAIAVSGFRHSKTTPLKLDPYSTSRVHLAFYFPKAGDFPAYPAHLSKAGEVVAHAKAMRFQVVDKPTTIDETSWAWLSQFGEEEQVLKFLETENLHAISLQDVAWRCRASRDFYEKVNTLLKSRGVFDLTLQSYAIMHQDEAGLVSYLRMQGGYLAGCGLALESDLIEIEPIHRRLYEHLEYSPLVNNRAHALGGANRILNPVIRGQYESFLEVLSERAELDDEDHLALSYYLFLQDRISEALAHLDEVDAEKIETKMQYDYFQAYAAFYREDLAVAKAMVEKYANYPVDRWHDRFAELGQQLAEISGSAPSVIEEGNREQNQNLAATLEPALSFKVQGDEVILDYQNLEQVTVNYYEMDLEFLFSTSPFVESGTGRFAIIQPNETNEMVLVKGESEKFFTLPEKYRAGNVIVEIVGGGQRAAQAVYANDLKTMLSETMGMLSVKHRKTKKPLSKVYVKVYAETDSGVSFFKDGYTDLRGQFDYASVSTTGLGQVNRFSILVMSEEDGATVLEATPPSR